MVLNEALLAEFDQEVVTARKTLERVPEDRFDWAPHTKSGSMGRLAGHLANIPSWAGMVINWDELDLAPGGKAPEPPPAPATTADLVAMFDKNVREAPDGDRCSR